MSVFIAITWRSIVDSEERGEWNEGEMEREGDFYL
jgi:hypothetical protein